MYKCNGIHKIVVVIFLILVTTVSIYAEPASDSKQHTGKSYLLAIGVNNYQFLPRMDSSVNNAVDMAEAFQKMGSKGEITLLTDKDATKERIKTILLSYQKKMMADDCLIIYYSGHGGINSMNLSSNATTPVSNQTSYQWRDSSIYDEDIMPVDATFSKSTQLTTNELSSIIKALPTQNIAIIIDASYNPNTSWTGTLPTFQSVSQMIRPRSSIRDLNMYGVTVVNSTDWNEAAWDQIIDGKKRGVFTHYLVQGMVSKIADRNKDGKLSIQEAFEYARLFTMQEVGIQHSQIYRGKNPNMIMIDYNGV
jgi:hypothetical protein